MTIIVGHRGAAAHAPENTLVSFALGVEQGADAVELDLHLSADGHPVGIHDDSLDRTTDGSGTIASLPLRDIRRADAGAAFAGPDGSFPYREQGLTVPTLAEVLSWLPDGIGLVLEIKARAAVAKAIEALRDHPVRAAGLATLISFDERAIAESRELDPGLPTGYLLVPGQQLEPAMRHATEQGHEAVLPWEGDLGMDPTPLIDQARAYGRHLGCYVVNDPERMQLLAAYGLWAFVTDVPDVARAALGPRAT